MNPLIASAVYACGIAGLFYLDRDNSTRTSKALWLPVVYLWAVGSRPISAWLGIRYAPGTNVQLEGSPIDRVFFLILLLAAVFVIAHRWRRARQLLKANWPILIYFAYCLVTVVWSNFPGVAFKRWTKSIGDLLMILIVLTDQQPVAAIRRLLSRTGFVLIPLSLLLIKYYPNLGRAYGYWSGALWNTGVTLNKNSLGVITFVLLLGAVWRVLALLRSEEMPPHRGRHLLAQGALLLLGVYILMLADSNTATVCFVFGAGLLFMMSLRFIRHNAGALHALLLGFVFIACSVVLLGGMPVVTHALGRNSTLTGRTDIWAAVISMAPNPVVGAGFESFWLSPSVNARILQLFQGLPLNEAHNAYIEVYLELGWVGVGLIGLILLTGHRRSVKAFRREPLLGSLLIAYLLSVMLYGVAEAGFRMMMPSWIFFLFAVIESSRVAADVEVSQSLDAFTNHSLGLSGENSLSREHPEQAIHKSSDDEQFDLAGTYKRI